jgi:hypothetical protein
MTPNVLRIEISANARRTAEGEGVHVHLDEGPHAVASASGFDFAILGHGGRAAEPRLAVITLGADPRFFTSRRPSCRARHSEVAHAGVGAEAGTPARRPRSWI